MSASINPADVVDRQAKQIWKGLLDQLEHDLALAVEQLSSESLGTVAPPPVGGILPPVAVPMPASVIDRAQRLLAQQAEVSEALSGALDQTRRQLGATRHFASDSAAAVYLDVSA